VGDFLDRMVTFGISRIGSIRPWSLRMMLLIWRNLCGCPLVLKSAQLVDMLEDCGSEVECRWDWQLQWPNAVRGCDVKIACSAPNAGRDIS
jgi:hypothetical protein